MPRRPRLPIDETRCFATLRTAAHARDFTSALASHFGVTRTGAAPVVRRLEGEDLQVDLRPSKLAPGVRAMIMRTGFALPG